MPPDPYIRFRNPDDLGLRPPDASLYTTPAITIVKPTGVGLNEDPAVIHAGVDDQFVRVEVSNKGDADADATVTAWAFGFGTNSNDYSGSFGGVLGVSTALTIPAGATEGDAAVQFDWKPQAAEIGGTQRHFCIRANVFVDPADQEPDPNVPGSLPDIRILTNIRHGQRNMTLLPKPVTLRESMDFDLAIANPDAREAQEFRFEVREVRGRFERNEIAHLRRTNWVDPEFKKGLVLPGTGGEVEVTAARRRAQDFAVEFREKSGKELVTKLDAGEGGTMRLQMLIAPGDTAAVHRFDVLQHDRKGIVGGARVMVIAVPEELLEPYEQAQGA